MLGKDGKLKVTKTPNAENPWVHGETPLLTMDVWVSLLLSGRACDHCPCQAAQANNEVTAAYAALLAQIQGGDPGSAVQQQQHGMGAVAWTLLL